MRSWKEDNSDNNNNFFNDVRCNKCHEWMVKNTMIMIIMIFTMMLDMVHIMKDVIHVMNATAINKCVGFNA